MGRTPVHALRCINLAFRQRETVVVAGPSGSGKTTLLHILGGLDDYSRGDMLFCGQSTSRRSAAWWSAYRRSVGVLGAAPLLPDRTLLENARLAAELALGPGEAGHRARAALQEAGLAGLEERYPGELASGERKLAELACALARDPALLLADEPADGLDEKTAEQVMTLLREEGRKRLVVIAARDAELACGGRVVRLDGGMLDGDNSPYDGREDPGEEKSALRRGMPFGLSLKLALRNLGRRRARLAARLLTGICAAFAAAFLLAQTTGLMAFTARAQADALSVYPITLTQGSTADLHSAADWLKQREGQFPASVYTQYSYAVEPEIYASDTTQGAQQVNPAADGGTTALWTELPESEAVLEARYELVTGRWPMRYDEVILLLDSQGLVSQSCLRAMGLTADAAGETEEQTQGSRNYDAYLRMTFRLLLPTDSYFQNVDGSWGYMGGDSAYMATEVNAATSIKVVGIARPGADTGSGETGGVGYTVGLTGHIVSGILNSAVVLQQQANPTTDVLTGLPFDSEGKRDLDEAAKAAAMTAYAEQLSPEDQMNLYKDITGAAVAADTAASALRGTLTALSGAELAALYDRYIGAQYSGATYEGNLAALGAEAAQTITEIRLYAATFADRTAAAELLETYSEDLSYADESAGLMTLGEELLTGGEETLRVLCMTAFAVSALLMAAVTAVSVRGRREELGTLTLWGASRREVTRVYAAEGLLTGLLSGAVGILAADAVCLAFGVLGSASGAAALTGYQIGLLAAVCVLASAAAGALSASATAAAPPAEILRRNG